MPTDGFEVFLAEKDWPDGQKSAARQLAQLRMMRGKPKWTESEWDDWAASFDQSPAYWQEHEHEHEPTGIYDKAGPPYCAKCWVELKPLTHEPVKPDAWKT